MDGINERISWCIKDSNLTKTAFAARINVSQQHVSRLTKDGNPSERTINDICREFGISEEWLRTGTGAPKIEKDEDTEWQEILAQITVSDDELIKRIIKAYWGMSDDEKNAIKKLIDKLSG